MVGIKGFNEIPGYAGKYIINKDGVLYDTISGKYIEPKVYGKMTQLGYRLYDNGVGAVRSIWSWVRTAFPQYRKEGFKDIVGYEGLYGVARDGKVYSYTHSKLVSTGKTTRSPYLYVKLYKENEVKQY